LRERLKIGEVTRLLGVTTKTVRHYEKVGLLGEPQRSEAGYRLYTADDLLLRSAARSQSARRVLGAGKPTVLALLSWFCNVDPEFLRGATRTCGSLR